MTEVSELPLPNAQAQQHSQHLCDYIFQHIDKQQGMLRFVDYMQDILYAPALGYYSAGMQKFGVEGDFVTAPEISPLFSQVIALQIQPLLESIKQTQGRANILEVGAGSGRMAVEILKFLQVQGKVPDAYDILELSAELRQRQQQCIHTELPAQIAAKVHWLDNLPQQFNGVVVGNELIDAFPVHLFKYLGGQIQEGMVTTKSVAGQRCFQLVYRPTRDPALLALIIRLHKLLPAPDDQQIPYFGELNMLARQWISRIADMLEKGAVLLIDYGYPEQEYYHPQRNMGTLRCHYRHLAHNDPFVYPGLQDVTAHVNFSDLAYAARDSGLDLLGYTTQAHFLSYGGLESLLTQIDHTDHVAFARIATQIKKLVLPQRMGELFKVIQFGKGITEPLSGFKLFDMRYKL